MSKLKTRLKRKKLLLIAGLLVVAFSGIQFIYPAVLNPPVTADFRAPPDVKAIIRRACYDCHSNETNLRWYDKIAPVYWQVAAHVKDGRQGLNFSSWQTMSPADQQARLWEAVNQIVAGAMPVKSYEMVHPAAKILPGDLAILEAYVGGMAVKNYAGDTGKINAANHQLQQFQSKKKSFSKLPVASNGIAYVPDYKNWQTLSTTDRYDNGTMRVILGNDIAVKAVRENNVHPWPNGTILAKVAWDQLEDKDGNVKTGAFKQVEYMIKDDKKYAATMGWGFARFKTPDLVPYGKTAMFATECINCHRPMKDADFVFTQPIKQ